MTAFIILSAATSLRKASARWLMRASRPGPSRRRSGRGRRARTSGRSRSRCRRAAARRACRRPGPSNVSPGRRWARRSRARRRNGRRGRRRAAASTSRQTRSIASPKSRLPVLVLGPARREDARPAVSASTHRPLSSASAGRPDRSAASRAFRSALSTKVLPISSGSGRSSSAAPTQARCRAARAARDLAQLARIVGRDDQLVADRPHRPVAFKLRGENLAAADPGEAEQPQQAFLVEAFALGGDLRLDDRAVAGEHEIAVAAGVAVLLIIEVEHRRAVVDAAADRGDLGADRVGGKRLCGEQLVDRDAQRDPAPEMAAVRVPPSAWMTSQSTVIWRSPSLGRSTTARSERPISRWISWVRPDCLPPPPRDCRGCGWRAAACHIRR
jgi:hypothetical protein